MSTSAQHHVAVIGGGLTGLSAALELTKHANVQVTLFEKGPLGGKIGSAELGGQLLPTGPDAFLARRPEVSALAIELGLESELIEPSASRALIARNGALHSIPRSVLGIPADLDAVANSTLLSAESKDLIRFAATHPDPPSAEALRTDISVGQLVRSALGDEVLEYLVDPLLGGINAGDSDRLSVQAGVPQIDMLRRDDQRLVAAAATRLASATTGPVFQSLRGGLSTLIEAAGRQLEASGVSIVERTVDAIGACGSTQPVVDGHLFDHVIVTTPPQPTADLLAEVPHVAEQIASIDMSSVALLLLRGERASFSADDDVSGILVPRQLNKMITAVSVAHLKWPHLTEPGEALLRVSVGRRDKTAWKALTDQELVAAVADDLEDLLGTRFQAIDGHVTRWHDALPQYDVGHQTRVDRLLRSAELDAPALTLTGAWRDGLGLPACVASGRSAAREAIAAFD